APPRRSRRSRGAPRRGHRQRPLGAPGNALRGDAELHPLRRMPERLPGVPQDRRHGIQQRLLGADGGRAGAAALRPRARGSASTRVVALRCVYRGVPRRDPTPRVVARASTRPRRPRDRVAPRTSWLHRVVVGMELDPRLPHHDDTRAPCPAARGARRARQDLVTWARAPSVLPPVSRPSMRELFVERAREAGCSVLEDGNAGIEADYGIAETGSLVFIAARDKTRASWIDLEVLDVELQEDRIVRDLEELFALLQPD